MLFAFLIRQNNWAAVNKGRKEKEQGGKKQEKLLSLRISWLFYMLIHSIIIINYKVFMFSILFYKNLKFRNVFQNINRMDCDTKIWKQLLTTVCMISCFICVWLCNTMDCSPTGFSVHGTLLARILAWVAMSSSKDLPHPYNEPASPVSPSLQVILSQLSHLGNPKLWHSKEDISSSMLISLKDYRWEAAQEAFIFLDSPH